MAKRYFKDGKKWNKLLKLIVSFGLSLGTGLAGSVFTFRSINNWYAYLNKPSFSPPNAIFGPVWTFLYITIAIALYWAWSAKKRSWFALACVTLNLILNFLWSLMFFGLHDIRGAFIEIIFLWLSIVVMMVKFWWVDKRAAIILLPYLLWVAFAAFLNYTLVLLN